ncbi:MAG: LOG family protein [Parachlamydiaceae bacterium]|nr:LOG family protein [Parachlamydiaceae bacterium]
MTDALIHDQNVINSINSLITEYGGIPGTFAADLTSQMIQTSLKLMAENHDIGQMKLISRALKEMRHAYSVFNKYQEANFISIFGSARTPEDHPDFLAAEAFSMAMAKEEWMCITGAANGIMHAGVKGAQQQSSFGLSIRLPFETPTNSLIKGDPKLMIFRYFFIRKLMFLSHSHAIAVFPGGFGTQDELFEALTLMQTGKSNIVPLILMEGEKGSYWKHWEEYMNAQLFENGWTSPDDRHLYYIATSPTDAKKHILRFYNNYHSSRYVNSQLVIRIKKPISKKTLDELNDKFELLVASGKIVDTAALPEETDHLDLPRIAFHHTRKNYGLLRSLIDHLN